MTRIKYLNSFIGDKDFYKKLMAVALPIVIQNTITNLAGLLDNVMVGQIGTNAMNGVSVVNQLMFVFNLCVWGVVCSAGIFSAQFFGKGDHQGLMYTFRAKIIFSLVVSAASLFLLYFKGSFLILQFLHQTDGIGNIDQTLQNAQIYLKIMLWGLVPLCLAMAYSNTLRSIGQTALPMKAGVAGVFVNLVLNYVLIFGHFGFPFLGVKGAAIATVISRFVELFIIVFWTHTHQQENRFIVGAYKSLKIPGALMANILLKGAPLALNEAMWALGLTLLNQSYSLRGMSVIAALNINSTILNLFNVFLFAMGEAIAIIVGNLLGAKKYEEARLSARRLIFMSVLSCFVIGSILLLCRNIFPQIYNTEAEVRFLASKFIVISAIFMPIMACVHGCYFTLRCGGKTVITLLFDSVFVWFFAVPTAACLTRFTSLDIFPIYLAVTSLDILKACIGIILVKKGIWVNNIVSD